MIASVAVAAVATAVATAVASVVSAASDLALLQSCPSSHPMNEARSGTFSAHGTKNLMTEHRGTWSCPMLIADAAVVAALLVALEYSMLLLCFPRTYPMSLD